MKELSEGEPVTPCLEDRAGGTLPVSRLEGQEAKEKKMRRNRPLTAPAQEGSRVDLTGPFKAREQLL